MGNSKSLNQGMHQNAKHQFSFQYVVGRGGFGKVWLVRDKKSKKQYALKQMSKIRIVNKRSVHSVMNERKLLSLLKHPFIVNMQSAFQDPEHLYLVMDLMSGRDLRVHLNVRKTFTEPETKFFVACVITGLEYLHLNKILHRDIKPENLVLDERGYLRITDFGIARKLVSNNAKDTSGTPGYMAPEVMCGQNHGIAVDYFALGVLAYEFMTGTRPYHGRSRKELKDMVMSRQAQLKRSHVPKGWSVDAADFINKLIMRRPVNRLGRNGPSEVKQHSWFRDFDWKKLFTKTLRPPFRPPACPDSEFSEFDFMESDVDANKINQSVQDLFVGYDITISENNNEDNTMKVRRV